MVERKIGQHKREEEKKGNTHTQHDRNYEWKQLAHTIKLIKKVVRKERRMIYFGLNLQHTHTHTMINCINYIN